MSTCSYVDAHVQTNKNTPPVQKRSHTLTDTHRGELGEDVSLNPSSASVPCGALQPRGEAPASSPASGGQGEHLAPQKGRPRPQPLAPRVQLRVKEASPAARLPPLPSAAPPAPRVTCARSLSPSRCNCCMVTDGVLQLLISSALAWRKVLFSKVVNSTIDAFNL